MHKPILDGLESYLSGHLPALEKARFSAHLAECDDCRAELDLMQSHAELVRLLRPPVLIDPSPGFYARVMERIESQAAPSLWSIFLEPAFGTRLMVAALGLFVVLAGAAWQTQPDSMVLEEHNPVSVLAAYEMPPASGLDPQQDRNVVFVKLATYGGDQAASLLPVSSD